MNKRVLSLLFLVLVSLTTAMAQDNGKMTVKGVVVDAVTNEPIAFANLGLLGTLAGAASNVDGEFELSVPAQYATHMVRVSAVGYAVRDMKFYEFKELNGGKVSLRPITYSIGEVNVVAELLTYKKLIADAVAAIGKNYLSVPHNFVGYYKETFQVGMDKPKVKEAIVEVYDATGYKREDVAKTYGAINYKINEVKRNFNVASVYDGLAQVDEILLSDVVRNMRNIMDVDNSKDYRFQNKGKLSYNGDSVQIIGYSAFKPTASNSGVEQATKYEGELYVNLKDKAVLKNITRITTNGLSSLGRNLVALEGESKQPTNIVITTSYKKIGAKYFLSGTSVDYTYNDAKLGQITKSNEFVTTKINRRQPRVIDGRHYYENIPQNDDFWSDYSVYFQGEE
ncbi:MAG: carboxypeptidase-like regulatory domain-containing protein [Marinifilaceae bacterium]